MNGNFGYNFYLSFIIVVVFYANENCWFLYIISVKKIVCDLTIGKPLSGKERPGLVRIVESFVGI